MTMFTSISRQRVLSVGLAALALTVGTGGIARAGDAIPYPNIGTPNPVTYTFTALADGDVMAYFAGSTAAYDNELGMLVNGVSTGVIGLDNHSSFIGQSLNLGTVKAGDSLVFQLINHALGMTAYSDPSLNVAYDVDGSVGHNHIYSTPYTGTGPVLDSIPSGTFVAFEDLRFPQANFNYDDEDFVFTDVASHSTSVPDAGSSLALLGIAFVGIGSLRRRLGV